MSFELRIGAATALVIVLGLAAELGDFLLGAPPVVVELFSLSYEHNVPTWYASSLLLGCGAVSVRAAPTTSTPRRWHVLGSVFAYISLDEAVQIHEHLGGLITGHGVFFFSWVIPASVLVVAFATSMLPLLQALPSRTRNRVVVAGCIYVFGALVLELPLGWWTERHGDDNLVYGLIDFVEESLELIGATLFLTTTWRIPDRHGV